MRWAILQLLGEFAPDIPLLNEEIANRLRDGGIQYWNTHRNSVRTSMLS